MLMKKSGIFSLVILLSVSLAAGCTNGGGAPTDNGQSGNVNKVKPIEPVKTEPVTITLYAKTLLLDGDFERYIKQPLKEKFPHVTINKINSEKGRMMEDLIVAGEIPDLIWEGLTNIQGLTDLQVPMDLEPLAKKHSFDLNRLESSVVNNIRSYSQEGKLIYIPYRVLPFGLHYNKSLFDKFGVEYPKNGITWDQAAELAKKLSRTQDGVTYRGLHAGINVNRIQTQMSLPFIDAKTNKSLIGSSEGWKKLFTTFKDIYGIPGNYPEGAKFSDGRTAFLKNRNLAMFPHLILIGDDDFAQAVKDGLEWGIVTFPVSKEKPNVGPGVFSDGFVIPEGSKQPDLAFQLITHLLSDEVQALASKMGSMTPLKNAEIKKMTYADNPLAKGQDLTPLLNLSLAEPYTRTPYDKKAESAVTKHLEQYITDKIDLNTALRQADEEINKIVETELSKKK